jgi:hypothetical protein
MGGLLQEVREQNMPTHGSQQTSLALAAFNHKGGETLEESP